MSWIIFETKYKNQEMWAFEQMSYLLFCAEFKNRVGLFRYKNQIGIETEPIESHGKFYGFQSKYYSKSITSSKKDILDSITKAKSKNPNLNELLFYINREFSESTIESQKKPKYKIEIEEYAESIGVNIQWRVPSHIELQLSLPENKYIKDLFFSLDPNAGDLHDQLKIHNDNILQSIQIAIPYGSEKIKIDRNSEIKAIEIALKNKKNIIIYGEGGCGKTALLKEFYNSYCQTIPFCVFKANELNENHINDIFNFDHKFSFLEFLDIYKDEPQKIFVIDSAEKLAEFDDNEVLISLIRRLKENSWNIIFTTRNVYLQDLIFHIKENYQLSFDLIDIPLINVDKLKSLGAEFSITLPDNPKFLERLRNLFYLREYILHCLKLDKDGNYTDFIDLLWKKRIQNKIKKDNLHLEREKCIIEIVKERCETGRFYINAESLPQTAIYQLKQDEILGYDDNHNGYFITHDIYEEWALDKIVSRHFANYSNEKEFFEELGDSLPIRRAFRLWLSNHLLENSSEIHSFMQDVFLNDDIVQFWKDEVLVSVLLSDYSTVFFDLFEKEIVDDDFKILKRILFLLRIACLDISEGDNFEYIKPKGAGWKEAIALIYKYRSEFFYTNLSLILPIFSDWCEFNKKGETTKLSGLLALSLISKGEDYPSRFASKTGDVVLKIIFNSSSELQHELTKIIDKVIANAWVDKLNPYEELCDIILQKPYLAVELIKVLPQKVIELCDFSWKINSTADSEFWGRRESVAIRYGLADKQVYNYFPPSANQTPINLLLKVAFFDTLDFIIEFTNYAIDYYSQSDYGTKDVEKVILHIDEITVTQYFCDSFWCMYRGPGSPIVPNLLVSMHMALEQILLKYSQDIESKTMQNILKSIITRSRSTSLTSLVCSIVLANPDKFYDVALILFKTIEFFHVDSIRSWRESEMKMNYSIGAGFNKLNDVLYTKERLETCNDAYRKNNLESLILNYQYFGVECFTEEQNIKLIDSIYKIIDTFKTNEGIEKSYGILLARMDRRNLAAEITETEDNNLLVKFTPKELSSELKKQSEEAEINQNEMTKYSLLRLWADFLRENTNQTENIKYSKYDKSPLLALLETKELINALSSGQKILGGFEYPIPAFSCSKLIIEYKKQLSDDDKFYCREVIEEYLSCVFSDNYGFYTSEAIEASIHAIPSLIDEYPDKANDYILAMTLALQEKTSIGGSKRVCDYVIESIHRSRMWNQNAEIAQLILRGYLKLNPFYRKIVEDIRKEKPYEPVQKSLVLSRLEEINIDLDNPSFDINLLDIYSLEIVLQLIPSYIKNETLLDIYAKALFPLTALLLTARRSLKEASVDHVEFSSLRLRVLRNFSHFILQRDNNNEIDFLLKPFLEFFSTTQETCSFIKELINAEISIYMYDQFWYIWRKLYPKVIALCYNSHINNSNAIIENYLLASIWWSEGVLEWRSLRKENLWLYKDVSKDIGHNPAVLYSIVKVLNSIAASFKDEGVNWIETIISNNKSLDLGDLESDTLYYLERFLRKYVFRDRQKIRKDIRLKKKVMVILDFIIERGSMHGYLLRESLL